MPAFIILRAFLFYSLLSYNIIKRLRKLSSDYEIIEKYFKIHLIPILIHIYRDIKEKEKKFHRIISLSPAFLLLYEYCLNKLNYYCSIGNQSSSTFNVISMNEALLMCPCDSCGKLQKFLLNSELSTLIFDLSKNSEMFTKHIEPLYVFYLKDRASAIRA